MALFEECKVAYDKVILSSKLVKILVPITVIIVIVTLIVVYIVLKKKKFRFRTKTKTLPSENGQTLIEQK